MLWSTRLLNVMLHGPVTAAAHHDETYCLTLMKVYRKWRYLHVCVGNVLQPPQKSMDTHRRWHAVHHNSTGVLQCFSARDMPLHLEAAMCAS